MKTNSLWPIFLLSLTSAWGGDWPQWRGPARDGHAPAGSVAPKTLPVDLQPKWKIAIGTGHSSPVVGDDRVVFLDEEKGKEVAHALNAGTGKEIWKVAIDEAFGDEWGSGPRSTPVIEGDRVYVQSCRGELQCLELATGKLKWRINFQKDYGVRFLGGKANEGTATRRGNSGSSVIDGDHIYVPVGSVEGASIVCLDKTSGREIWRANSDEAAYSSPIVATLAGVRQVVAFTAEGLVGLDRKGKVLWRVPLKTNAKRHVATPVVVGDNVVVNSHTIGMMSIQISQEGGTVTAKQAWANPALKINLGSAVLVDGHLYNQGAGKDYVCVDASNGKLKWSQPGFGEGKKDYSSTIAVGNSLLVLTEDGTLLLLAADPAQYRELGRLQVCGNTWSFPAYANGHLFVRDGRSLACVDLLAVKTASLR